MLTLNDLDTLDLLFKFLQSEEEVIKKFILFKTGCKTLKEAREVAVVNRDIAWLFDRIDSHENSN